MKTTRVHVANRPRLLRELILNTISEEADIEIVGEIQQESEIPSSVDRTHPDCLIVALEQAEKLPAVCVSLLRENPNLKVIAIAGDGNSLRFYWTELLIQSKQLEASEAAVLSALRGEAVPAARLQ
jgi:DNA-binding NarL/FixJ family response regulator